MNKILSISVAAYNAEKDLPRCLDSMVNTSVAGLLDIIVVNDGSKDDTLVIARDYEKNYPGIVRVIDKENGGHGSTINASIPAAVGKYYKVVDSDDWVDAEGLVRLIEYLKDTDADLVFNPYQVIDAESLKEKSLVWPYASEIRAGETLDAANMSDILLEMHAMTYRTEVLRRAYEKTKIAEHCFYVDVEYDLFPLPYVKRYACLDFPVYQYLQGTITQSMSRESLIRRRDQYQRVTRRITRFYEAVKSRVSDHMRRIILDKVHRSMLYQYDIFMNMPPGEAKPEVLRFDRWIKNNSTEVYEGPNLKLMKLVRFHRKTGFVFYTPITYLLMRLGKTPRL